MSIEKVSVGLRGLDSATLFIPGGSSYIVDSPDGEVSWTLAERSEHRATVARDRFDPAVHDAAVFSGGYPGVAAGWSELDPRYIPPAGSGEATSMAKPLLLRLRGGGWSESDLTSRVRVYDQSSDTFGDVLGVIESGYLRADTFHSNSRRGVEIVAGRQAARVAAILITALDLDPKQIRRSGHRDVLNRRGGGNYRPRPERHGRYEAMEHLAGLATRAVLRDVAAGDLDGVREAQARFGEIARQGLRGLVELKMQRRN